MLIIMRVFVVEWKTAVRVVALLETFLLNPQEGIYESGPGRLLLGGEEECAVDFAAGIWAGC